MVEHISDILKKGPQALTASVTASELPLVDKISGEVDSGCPYCNGSGMVYPLGESGKPDFMRTVICPRCKPKIEERRRRSLLRYCGLPAATEHMTLESYNTKGYDTLRTAKELAMQLVSGSEKVKWLTILSESDRGKTHLAIGICRKWLEKGLAAKYAFVPDFLMDLRAGYDSPDEGYSFTRLMQVATTVPLLVLDDLGTERPTEWAVEQLQIIIHKRGVEGLPLVVTSNKRLNCIVGNEKENRELASMRIASRLQRESWCHVVVLDDSPEHRLWNGGK